MRKLILGLFVAAALVVTPVADAARPGPSYLGQSLGALPGDDQSRGEGVNDAGSVVGRSWSSNSSGERAFYWDRPTDVLYQLTTSGATGAAYAIAGGSGGIEYVVGYERAAGGGNRAVIWNAPPSSGPIFLDSTGSTAYGVNDAGFAVGLRSGLPVIWAPDGNNGYVATNIGLLPDQEFGLAQDINNDGIVVGYNAVSADDSTLAFLAFLRLTNGTVIELAPAEGDTDSIAFAVSNEVTVSDDSVVYVAGVTINANGAERGVRWTVNVGTGAMVALTVLNMQFAAGVNDAGDVAGASSLRRGQAATLWRNGTYITLQPPRGGRGTGCFYLARSASSPTYAVGQTILGRRTGIVAPAVVWEVN